MANNYQANTLFWREMKKTKSCSAASRINELRRMMNILTSTESVSNDKANILKVSLRCYLRLRQSDGGAATVAACMDITLQEVV